MRFTTYPGYVLQMIPSRPSVREFDKWSWVVGCGYKSWVVGVGMGVGVDVGVSSITK